MLSGHPSLPIPPSSALRALAGTQIITDILQHVSGSVKHLGTVSPIVTDQIRMEMGIILVRGRRAVIRKQIQTKTFKKHNAM
jgi:hypothetical protein